MAIRLECAACKSLLEVSDELAGKKAGCPKCMTILQVPVLSPQSAISNADLGQTEWCSAEPIHLESANVKRKRRSLVALILLLLAGASGISLCFFLNELASSTEPNSGLPQAQSRKQQPIEREPDSPKNKPLQKYEALEKIPKNGRDKIISEKGAESSANQAERPSGTLGPKRSLALPGGDVYDLAFSPDGKVLAMARSHEVSFYDGASGKELLRVPGMRPLEFSHAGKYLVFPGPNVKEYKIHVLETATGKVVRSIPGHFPLNYSEVAGMMKTFALLPASQTIAIAEGTDLKFYDLETGKLEKTWTGPTSEPRSGLAMQVGPALFLAASPDGKWLAQGNQSGLQLWDLRTGKTQYGRIRRFTQVRGVYFSPDGKSLAVATGGSMAFVDPATASALGGVEQVLRRPGQGKNEGIVYLSGEYLVGFSKNGRHIATANRDRVGIWDGSSHRLLAELASSRPAKIVRALAFSDDGSTLAVAAGGLGMEVRFYDVPAIVKAAEPPKFAETDLPSAIKAPILAKSPLTIDLDDKIGGVAVGAGGRFLILHLAKKRKLALFDVGEARVVHEFPAPEANIKFAAGREKLVIVRGKPTHVVERWDLKTKKLEVTEPALPGVAAVNAVCMGSASRGPVLVQWTDDERPAATAPIEFLDLESLQPLILQIVKPNNDGRLWFSQQERVHFRASADGSVFGVWGAWVHSYVLAGKKLYLYYKHNFPGHAIPRSDGRIIYTHGNLLTKELVHARDGRGVSMPAHHGPYYLRVELTDIGPAERLGRNWRVDNLRAYHVDNDRPLASTADISVTMNEVQLRSGTLDLDQRIHFLPAAKLIVLIPPSDDRLELYRFDPDQPGKQSKIGD